MQSSERLWETYQLSKFYRCRASELLCIDDEWTAYQFDRAVFAFGSTLDGALNSVEGKTEQEKERKRLGVLRKWVPKALDASATSERRFADPASRSI